VFIVPQIDLVFSMLVFDGLKEDEVTSHVLCMGEIRNMHATFGNKSEKKRPAGMVDADLRIISQWVLEE
jgi:hypothetical protein